MARRSSTRSSVPKATRNSYKGIEFDIGPSIYGWRRVIYFDFSNPYFDNSPADSLADAKERARRIIDNKLPNGILDWFGLGPTSTTYSVKRPGQSRTSTKGMQYKGYKIWRTPEGEFEVPGIEKGTYFDTVGDAKKFIGYWLKQGNPGNMAKTKLDLILDKVKAKKHEITLDVRDYTEAQKQRIITTAEKRGLHAASDGKFILIRDLRGMNNPGNSKKGWIRVNAIRQLPSGDIQLALPKGTMSNPGKRKSLLKSVGKVFGKVVKTGKSFIK